jgi:hypothetical protein
MAWRLSCHWRLLAIGNLILRRICKMMVHLSVQNPLNQSLLQLANQTLGGNIVFGSLSFSSSSKISFLIAILCLLT